MSFCGFLAFSDGPGVDDAAHALERWLVAFAASANTTEWRSGHARGAFSTFTLVPDTAHFAELSRADDHVLVGDVPRDWANGPDGRTRRARLAAADTAPAIDAALPDVSFSLGLWSAASSRLTLYRCHLGTRALLYVSEPGAWIAFASLPEPLLTLPGVRGAIDTAALPSQLITGWDGPAPPGATLFSRLRRLPAGHVLRFGQAGQTVEPYWALPDHRERETFGVNDPEVPRTLRRLLDVAVQRRIAGVDRVGTQLSGGLDSSAVTALAHAGRDSNARVLAYTLRSHDENGALIGAEEDRIAAAFPAWLGDVTPRVLIHHKAHKPFYLCQREYLERPLPDMVFKFGPDHRLLGAARRDGCGVMLTGWGGDQMASARGNLHLLAMMREGRWGVAYENLLGAGGWLGALRALKNDVAAPVWGAYRRSTRWSRADRRRLRDIVRGTALEASLSSLSSTGESWWVRERRRERVQDATFQASLELQDWLGQRAGVAVHHPLLDRDVVAFCDRMPPEWIAHLGVKRRAFRAALGDLLPPVALTREKAPFERPADHRRWRLRQHAHFARAVRDLAASDSWLHQYLNLRALSAAVARRPERKDDSLRTIQTLGANALVVARCERSS